MIRKFKQEGCPSVLRMVIILPHKDIFKARKSAILECAKACEKRGVSWVHLYYHDVNKENLTFLFKKPSVKYIYWCGHGNSHIEETPRTNKGFWEKKGFWAKWSSNRAFSFFNTQFPLPNNWDNRGFSLWSLGMHDSRNKKIIFVDACLNAKYNDMPRAYGVLSLDGYGFLDQIYIGWRIKVQVGPSVGDALVGYTTEGIRLFWERMGYGGDLFDALQTIYYSSSGGNMNEAFWGENRSPDIGSLYGDDNLFLWGNGLIDQMKLEP